MRSSFVVLMVMGMIISSAFAFSYSVEITTGSKAKEGVIGEDGKPLRDGCLVQVIRPGDGIIHLPRRSGAPTGGDTVIATGETGYNFPFNKDQGKFDIQIQASGEGDKLYVRVWNGPEAGEGRYWGDSGIFVVRGIDGEIWNIGGAANSPAIVVDERPKE